MAHALNINNIFSKGSDSAVFWGSLKEYQTYGLEMLQTESSYGYPGTAFPFF